MLKTVKNKPESPLGSDLGCTMSKVPLGPGKQQLLKP